MERREAGQIEVIGAEAGVLLAAAFAAGAGVAVFIALDSQTRSGLTIVLALLAGVVAGMLCTVTMQRSLYLAVSALHRLARGQPVEPVAAGRHWPFGAVMRDLDALGRRLDEQRRRDQETDQHREDLLRQVSLAAAQEERNRLARELHDSIKQQIFSMSMSAAAIEARWESDPEGARAALADVRGSAREAQVEMQALLAQLRPAALESVGLREALRIQCEALGYRAGVEVTLEDIDLPSGERLPPGAQETMFRIVQELLFNVARHARAGRVAVRLGQERDAVVLRVRDDGRGFDPGQATGGTGLAGVRERAQAVGGRLEVESVPGQGTIVQVQIPLLVEPVQAAPADVEIGHLCEERRKALVLGTRAAQIAAILIFLSAPFAAIAIGAGAALFGYVRARLFDAQIALRPGRPALGQAESRYQLDGLLAGILGLAALCVLYLPVAQPSGRAISSVPVVLAVTLLIGMTAAIECVRWFLGRNRYLGMLPSEERRTAIGRRLRELRGSAFSWAVIVLVVAFIIPLSLAFPPHTLDRWSDDSVLVILVAWPLIDCVEYLLTTRWRHRLSPVEV